MTENSELAIRDSELMNALSNTDNLKVIRDMFAKGCSDNEFAVLLELARRYRLDPFSRQIWAVKYGNEDAKIFCGRDGYLAIAHRSPFFDGMESGTLKDDSGELIGWCRVHRSDMKIPFYVQVYASEYTTKKSLWLSKPRTMIQKVAEAQCLRRAFDMSGFYDPVELGEDTADGIQGYSASSRMPTGNNNTSGTTSGTTQHQDMSTCSRCGKPALTGDRLNRMRDAFKNSLNMDLPIPICEDCANKMWQEHNGGAPSSTTSGVCKHCGKPALAGEKLYNYIENFRAVFNHNLEIPICQECVDKLWDEFIRGGKQGNRATEEPESNGGTQ